MCYINLSVFISACAGLFGTVGSLVVTKDKLTDQRALNLLPTFALFYGATLFGCYASHEEPFSVCVKTIISAFGG